MQQGCVRRPVWHCGCRCGWYSGVPSQAYLDMVGTHSHVIPPGAAASMGLRLMLLVAGKGNLVVMGHPYQDGAQLRLCVMHIELHTI